ncbi:MAG: VOC family protein [Candidatus Xenobia bacterium]
MSTQTKTYAPGTFCWNDLMTTDQNDAKKFYADLFGWTLNDHPVGEGQVYSMAFKDGKDVGAIAGMANDPKEPPHWTSYMAVASCDEAAKKVEGLGGKLLAPPFDVMDVGRMAVVQDPTGAVFALWEGRKHPGAGLRDATGAVCWNELMSPDVEKAVKFYMGLFGWSHEKTPMAEMGDYHILKGNGGSCGMMQWTKGGSYWLLYFSVDNCDATVAKVQKLGGQVCAPAQDIPDVGRFAVLADRQGANFAILQPTRK